MISIKQLKSLISEEVRKTLKEQEQMMLPGVENAGPRKIVSYYEKWTPEDVEFGEASDRGENDEYEIELDEIDREDGTTIPDLAVEYLKHYFAHEASSSHFHPGVWYTASDEHPYTGEREYISYHLKGFTKDEEKEIFDRMKS